MTPQASRKGSDAAALTIRVDLGRNGALGPGKIRLMELIGKLGSITKAGKALGMSYRRAWLLVDSLNQAFREPVIAKQMGGRGGGGAKLTDLGQRVVGSYRAIEAAAALAAQRELETLQSAVAAKPASRSRRDRTASE